MLSFQVKAVGLDSPQEESPWSDTQASCSDDVVLLNVGGARYELNRDSLRALPEDCPLRVMFECGLEPAKQDSEGYYLIHEDSGLFKHIINWVVTGGFQISEISEAENLRLLADRWAPSMIPLIDRLICLKTKAFDIEPQKLDFNSDSYYMCRSGDGLIIGLEEGVCCNKKMMESAQDCYKRRLAGQLRNFILMAIPCGHHFSYSHEAEHCMSRIYNLHTRKPIGEPCSFAQAVCQINNAVPPYIPAPVGEKFAVYNMIDGKRVTEQLFENPTSCLLYIYQHLLKNIDLNQ